MISLKTELVTAPRTCVNCGSKLTARGWLITGMRNLGDFQCSQCGREFFADLPSGQALYTPVLLDKNTGSVTADEHASWFSQWLIDSFAKRTNEPLGFKVRHFAEPKRKAVLLNCLDTLYGHSLLKLLNAQHYIDHEPDTSLIVMVPAFLEWMLPDGVAEAWVIDLPLRRGTEWNDWLAREVKERLEKFSEVYLSVAFSHPHGGSFEIERFTGVRPFDLVNLERFDHSKENPVVTFIWREDRLWNSGDSAASTTYAKIKRRFGASKGSPASEQAQKVIGLAESLRMKFPNLDFAVAGLGKAVGLPDWISDLRLTGLDVDAERSWCERYARSHFIVGVHGSNMLLPSAHAGGVIELISEDRLGNYLQDILFRHSDCREMLFRYRFVPISTEPKDLSDIAATMLRYGDFRHLMSPEYCTHQENYNFEKWLSRGSCVAD